MNNATTWDAGCGMTIPPMHPIPLNRRQIIDLRCGMVFHQKSHPIPLNLNEINRGMRDDNSPLKGTRGTSSHVAQGGLPDSLGKLPIRFAGEEFSVQYARARYLGTPFKFLQGAREITDGPSKTDGFRQFRDQYAQAREDFMQNYARAREYLYLEDIVLDDGRASFPCHRARMRAREIYGPIESWEEISP